MTTRLHRDSRRAHRADDRSMLVLAPLASRRAPCAPARRGRGCSGSAWARTARAAPRR